jgi:CubicO group peptidase (beta-lactamase class C family)
MGMAMRIVALLMAGLLPQALAAQKDSLPPPRTIPELEARIRSILEETKTPGIGITVVTRDSVVWVAGLGKADVASGRDATAETLFRIGSTSKAFVSLLALMLQEEGKLHLEDPVRRYAPEIAFRNRWEDTDPLRIVHLLEHATGWDDLALRDYALNDSALTLRQGLDYNPKTRTARWRPGTRVAYCNSGPSVAAYITEKIEGRPFEQLVQERLFDPIGMTTATYFRPPQPEQLATLYFPDGKTPQPYWHIIERPAGAINASARDMAAYVQFLLNRGAAGGKQIVPVEVIERMERPRSSITARSGLTLGYGLHLATYVDSGFVWVGHDGGVNGGLTNMAYRPEQGVGYAFMINSGSGKAFEQISRLVRDYLTRDQSRPVPPPVRSVSQLARARTGWYRPDNPRVQGLYFLERILGLARVAVTDSTLVLRPLIGKARVYVPADDSLFRGASDPVPTLALINDAADGRPEAIEGMGYPLPGSLHRIWAPVACLELVTTALFLLSLVVTFVFALVWIVRLVFRRLRGVKRLRVRVWPLVSALAAVAFVLTLVVGLTDPFPRLGRAGPFSITVFLMTLLFPVASVVGLVTALRAPTAEVRGGVRYHALIVSAVNVVVAAYLAWFGLIGWRSWS